MKKRFLAIVLVFTLVFPISANEVVQANSEVSVKLNGETLRFDVPPQIINGRTMVPMRTIFEKLGATVLWDSTTQGITSTREETTITLYIGKSYISINDKVHLIDSPPCIVDGRTLVPVRVVSESFDLNVEWDEGTRTVIISSRNFETDNSKFDNIKEIIVSKGEYMDNDYVIFVPVESKSERTYYYMAVYDFKDDTINFFFSSKGGGSNDSLLITLRREEKPTLFYSYMPKGYKFELYGVFPDVSTPYEIYKNEIPEQLFPSTEKVISTTLALMDFYTKEKIGVSFEELGIFYFND